jgi:hypothetical protein
MRVLCVGRHVYLSEHLCRLFGGVGAECEPAVGGSEALQKAARFEPHVVVSEYDLITPALLDAWTREPSLAGAPLLAVSLTRRPEESPGADLHGLAEVVYLPGLEREQAVALLASLYRPRGVSAPPGWTAPSPAPSTQIR